MSKFLARTRSCDAALVAARRTDVARLVTVAGNFDHREWTRWHNIVALDGSLNPPDFAAALAEIPQTHWVGGQDEIIGRRLADSFITYFPAHPNIEIRELRDANHIRGWIEHWPELLKRNDDPRVKERTCR